MVLNRLQIDALKTNAYAEGYNAGRIAGRKETQREQAVELRKVQIDLMHAVGQTIQSLASVFDTGPRN